ncbi:substrate-binding domain-containing protein [Actinokineospora inagensis]|uniref:substrate-binding domain-containing protein n=1 Tax=Actinokineospora inagensis TaxID=103730 RepID=UPI000419D94D|nr:substrate-binding domain-containing protein [Actinokineospora inagensis]
MGRGPVVVAVVSLLVLGWAGWGWVGDRLDREAAREQGCPSGQAVLRVAVTPSVEQPVRAAANRWNARPTVVDDHCVRVNVSSVDSAQAFAGLTGQWNTRELGDRPDVWLPESSLWTDRLAAVDDALLAAAPESVATSPVVLAAPQPAAGVLDRSAAFRWADLAALTTDTSGWTRFGEPGWGRLTVAVPTPLTNPASALAVQTTLIGVAQESPVTQGVLARPPVSAALLALAQSQPADVPDATRAALATLGDTENMADSPFGAVPALEVDLYRRNLGTDGRPAAKHALSEVVAKGPTPVADFPLVSLACGESGPTQVEAADEFRKYLQEPAQQRDFAHAGLRATTVTDRPAPAPGMTWGEIVPGAAKSDANTSQRIATTWSTAVEGGGIVTIMVDVSRTMGDDGGGGRSKLDWVKDALNNYADYTVSGSVGLWPFSHALNKSKPYVVAVPTGPVANRRASVHSAVTALTPNGGTDLYESVVAGYRSAVQGFVPGKRNQLIVITDGGSDGAMSLSQAKSSIRRTAEKDKPVPINVIAIGHDTDRDALRDLATSTGGRLSPLADAQGIVAALGQAVTARD